ncbi:flavin reductase family protein [Pararhodobacter aggregans]|uniref:Flavin oxidoreductase n=1 Tax=Pararhodobacter aggregans TaxID=404875 RepID=A0A2T7URJ7_9RHOB|nr:flavin reductase (DIM6/NTAB) family NADH-FMN oxidoreductase RutF [Pararhodobacter aggregans]PVE47208.1 flavin oxidoreductase [Pararhodobacter aggregans]
MSFARAERMSDPTEPPSFVPGPGTERDFRDALGAFATGVTVITAQSAIGPLGITANSFASLSMAPPLVLWSPGRFSRRFDAFVEAGHFAIHVLGAEQFELGRHFARQGHDFDLPGVAVNAQGVPVLPGCLAVFECAREAVHDGGDHAIVVGRVLAARHRRGVPLVFHRGNYGGFGA